MASPIAAHRVFTRLNKAAQAHAEWCPDCRAAPSMCQVAQLLNEALAKVATAERLEWNDWSREQLERIP